jgi:hypothetical protein
MHWTLTSRSALMLLVAVALLLARVGGAHLHLCFDGREAPATMHLEDAGLHHTTPGASQAHQDLDITAAGGLLSKLNLDLLGAVFAVFFFGPLLLVACKLIPAARLPYFSPLPHFLRPPLRGPPLPISR